MIVAEAKASARAWVIQEFASIPGVRGAFFHGSATWLPDEAQVLPTSDVDVIIVVDHPDRHTKPGKFVYQDTLLDVSFLSTDEVRSPEVVLGQYHLAGSFRTSTIVSDPSGHLTELQRAVAHNFAKREWVIRRRNHARDKVLHGYRAETTDPFPDQVVSWLFPAGILTHVLLVAGLRNPTVRRRYLAARDLLTDYGQRDFFERLLEILGCAAMTQRRAADHLVAVTAAFDEAKQVITTPFPFASDISDAARPIAIGGSQELIARGDHREAVFWLVATYSRCQQVFLHDATPETYARFETGYRALLADLGIVTTDDLRRRNAEVTAALPDVVAVSDAIIAANPEIED